MRSAQDKKFYNSIPNGDQSNPYSNFPNYSKSYGNYASPPPTMQTGPRLGPNAPQQGSFQGQHQQIPTKHHAGPPREATPNRNDRGGHKIPTSQPRQPQNPSKADPGNEDGIDTEFFDLEGEFPQFKDNMPKKQQRKQQQKKHNTPSPQLATPKKKPKTFQEMMEDEDEETLLLTDRDERKKKHGIMKRNLFLKYLYLAFFALASVEVLIIVAASSWMLHMISCMMFNSCTPTKEHASFFFLYFAGVFALFVVPYILGALGILSSSSRIIWMFSILCLIVHTVFAVLFVTFDMWQATLLLIPFVVVDLLGFLISHVLTNEMVERGKEARNNKCCLFLCC